MEQEKDKQKKEEQEKEKPEEEQQENEEKKEPEKKDTKWFLIAVLVIIACFVLFFAMRFIFPAETIVTIEQLHEMNLAGEGREGDYVYNGYSFVKFDKFWHTQVQYNDTMINLILRYGPKELEDIPLAGKLDLEGFNRGYLYITFNPDDENLQYVALSAADLSTSLYDALGVQPIAACAKNLTKACADRPIITCESNKPTIYIQQSDKEDDSAIIFSNKCVIIKGKDWGLLKAVNRFLLLWYKVMPA